MTRSNDITNPSLFTPENLLREARRQKGLSEGAIPRLCVLDPDGDIVRYLARKRRSTVSRTWACYHTELHEFRIGRIRAGIVGCAVGAPFAVLVAEEMFASGCTLLVSITSAGRIGLKEDEPRFLVLARALRDEGTSSHYAAPGSWSRLDARLRTTLSTRLAAAPVPVAFGSSWTTDAPFRETEAAIEQARGRAVDCVEMEAAGLYAFAHARRRSVVCLAHVTNSMAQSEGDFEKGAESGSLESLQLISFVARTLKDVDELPRE
jgi:uridine phosphorylase